MGFAINNENIHLVRVPESSYPTTRSLTLNQVAVIPLELSPAMRAFQQLRSEHLTTTQRSNRLRLPSRFDLGMNNVPIFDQGQHNTCVTFAITSAINASLNNGDYISQLCLLQLSSHLSDYSFWKNAWLGSWPDEVLGLIHEFGIITKEDQKAGACNNIKEYPIEQNDSVHNIKLSPNDYHNYSHKIFFKGNTKKAIIKSEKLIDFVDIGSRGVNYVELNNTVLGNVATPSENIDLVRKTLSEGNRVIVCILMKESEIFQGHYKTDLDTWFLSTSLRNAFSSEANTHWDAHALILYGYDDNAVVRNAKGETQKGVFFVRNSWGTKVPDNGIEFMTYDYFKLMTVIATTINTLPF